MGGSELTGLSYLIQARGADLTAIAASPGEPGRALQEVVDSGIVDGSACIYCHVAVAGNAEDPRRNVGQ